MNENKENNEKKHKIKQIKGKAQIVFKIKLKTLAPYHETFRRHDRKLFKWSKNKIMLIDGVWNQAVLLLKMPEGRNMTTKIML